MSDNTQDQDGKPFPPWVNWLLALLLMIVLVQMVHDKFRTGVKTPAPGRKADTVPVPSVVVSNPPVPVEPALHRAQPCGEDDVNVTELSYDDINPVFMADAGVTACVVDAYSAVEQATNVQAVIAVTARQRELVELARKTFARRNDPAYENDRDLAEVANAVAWFYLHYPSRSDCEHLAGICSRLEESRRYAEPVAGAIEGSRYIFQNEISMMDRGLYRYGRIWVDSNGLARINTYIVERNKRIEENLAKQRQEQARVLEKIHAKETISTAPVPKKPKLEGPDYPVKRIGGTDQSPGLKGPAYPVRRIGAE